VHVPMTAPTAASRRLCVILCSVCTLWCESPDGWSLPPLHVRLPCGQREIATSLELQPFQGLVPVLGWHLHFLMPVEDNHGEIKFRKCLLPLTVCLAAISTIKSTVPGQSTGTLSGQLARGAAWYWYQALSESVKSIILLSTHFLHKNIKINI
jgi:hypothetical protein